jgi:DNA modification methylase
VQNPSSLAVVQDLLNNVRETLANNPYNDLLKYKSTQSGQFFVDVDSNTVNPYQKPISLYFQLLNMFAMPDAVILDATCGTGSLELAAMEPDAPSGLEFVAFERNEYQAKHCMLRLQRSCTKPMSADKVMVDMLGEKHGPLNK